MKEMRFLGWFCFFSDEETLLDENKCGKWMYFFDDQKFAQEMCRKAIKEKICDSCKCTDMELGRKDSGVLCFYLNGDDIEAHKKVIQFMLDNELIKKTKSGRLYNMSFKFDNQTRAREYGADFEGKIKLEQFIDLNTGEWIHE